MTCERCGSYEIKRTREGEIVILHCLECGYTKEYPFYPAKNFRELQRKNKPKLLELG